MYLIIPYIPGIVAIIIGLVQLIRRLGYTKVKATIMTREHAALKKSSRGKMLYVATYVYEYEGQRVEKKNEKILTTAEEWEYIYLNKDGEIVDNKYNRYPNPIIFGIIWVVAIYFVLKTGAIG